MRVEVRYERGEKVREEGVKGRRVDERAGKRGR